MLRTSHPFTNKKKLWEKIETEHRSQFTHVRQIELPKASIRLPLGSLFVSVTERKNFDQIEEAIPNCVQTRLDEFLAQHGKRKGVEVYYLKPLCIESGNQLFFTSQNELDEAISSIQSEVFSEYRKRYLGYWFVEATRTMINGGLAVPRVLINRFVLNKKREIEAYHGQLEFERRKRAVEAVKTYREYRTLDCSYEEILSMSSPLERADVIEQYVADNELSKAEKHAFLLASLASFPWFVTLAIGHAAAAVAITTSLALSLCDPAFVAVMPGCKKTLHKIGHFDEVEGVMHVEIQADKKGKIGHCTFVFAY